MRALSHLLFIAFFALVLSTCQDTPEADRSETIAPAAPGGEIIASDAYYHLVGTVDTHAITMHLLRQTSWTDRPGDFYAGYYYYNRFQNPIAISGAIEDGQLVLQEFSGMQDESPTWTGAPLREDGSYSGTWKSAGGRRSLPFSLQPAVEPGIRLRTYRLVDSLPLYPDRPSSPRAAFRAQWLSAETGDAALDRFLNQAILKGMFGDSLGQNYQDLTSAVKAYRDAYFERYREEASSLVADGLYDTTQTYGLNYEEDLSMNVIFNSDSLLTLTYTTYNYSGGAHGNYWTLLQSYRPQSQQIIKIDEVFTGSYNQALTDDLEASVRELYQLSPKQPLTEILFEEKIEPTDNFGLTGAGIVFNYPPYAIAPYAAGEITLFVPFDAVTEVLKAPYRKK